jgi:ribosomal protein S18 acetylase RimI-like enzyme
MVGFIAHTTNTFQNELYLYNGGTGVIPEYRGLKLTEHMYHLAIRQMHQLGISRCILEVIDNNNFALASYTKIGFNKTRMLRCYKLKERSSWARGKALVLESLQEDELKGLPDTTIPSFMDCWDQLSKNRNNEKVLLLRDPGELIIGYCVLNPGNGRIARLWVREENRRAGVGRSLIGEANRYIDSPLTVINVDENNRTAHQFLIACGFENQINQWEMMMQIG